MPVPVFEVFEILPSKIMIFGHFQTQFLGTFSRASELRSVAYEHLASEFHPKKNFT